MPIIRAQKEELSSLSGDEGKLLTTELAVVLGATELGFPFPTEHGSARGEVALV